MNKNCSKCGIEKPLECFPKVGSKTDRRRPECKECRKEITKAKREADPTWPERQRASILRYKFGLTTEQYDTMLAMQGGACAICKRPEPGEGKKFFSVDHDHDCCKGQRTCGKCVRGLLCSWCNVGISYMQDNPTRLRAAAEYLEK